MNTNIKALMKAAQSVPVVEEPLTCDECGAATDDPWHSSESGSRHFHRCDACHTAALEAQRVPVVGEPVAWVNINNHGDVTRTVRRRDNWCTTPVFAKPTTSILAADLATLRARLEQAEKEREELLALLKEAYGYTTEATDLLPERIKAVIAKIEGEHKP